MSGWSRRSRNGPLKNASDRRLLILRCQQMYFVARATRFCGDLRQFADSEKKPQVFRKYRGSPALPNCSCGDSSSYRHE